MGSAGCGPKSPPRALGCPWSNEEFLGSQRYLRVGYGSYVDPASAAAKAGGVSAADHGPIKGRMQRHSLTISAAPCQTPYSSTVSYRSRGPHIYCKYGFIVLFLRLSAWERSTGLS